MRAASRDCDLDGAMVRVLRAATIVDGERTEKQPKSGEGRSITIDPATVAALRAHLDSRKVRSIQRDEYVVCDDKGKPWASNDLSMAFRAFAKRHKLENLRLHDLRHSHATILAAAGEHPRVVQERLGHADVAFTLRRYTGYWTNMQAGAAEKIGSLLGEAVAPAAADN
jgi:integrase